MLHNLISFFFLNYNTYYLTSFKLHLTKLELWRKSAINYYDFIKFVLKTKWEILMIHLKKHLITKYRNLDDIIIV